MRIQYSQARNGLTSLDFMFNRWLIYININITHNNPSHPPTQQAPCFLYTISHFQLYPIQRICMHQELNEENQPNQTQPTCYPQKNLIPVAAKSTLQERLQQEQRASRKTHGGDGQNGDRKQGGKQGFQLKDGLNAREQAINFFGDSIVEKQKNSRQGQQNLFKRTYSFYEEEPANQTTTNQQPQAQLAQTTQAQTNSCKPPQTQIEEEEARNKFVRPLASAEQYLRILKYSNYLHLLRFLFIGLIYYNLSFKILSKDDKENVRFMPWNAMIYFLSGSIDFISVIGYISSIRLLQSDINILKSRWSAEEEALKRKQVNQGQLVPPEQVPNQNIDPELELHQTLSRENRPLRLGKQSSYSSVYSTLRQFKYKNRDQAAPFKICKIMHFCATFLFFGRMALIELYDFQQPIITFNGSIFAGELCLWLFLILAYFAVFEIDYFVMESSSGPWIKIDRFYFRRVLLSYQQFWDWRHRLSVFSKIGILFGLCLAIYQLILHLQSQTHSPSLIFIASLASCVANFTVAWRNEKIVAKSKQFIDLNVNSSQQSSSFSAAIQSTSNPVYKFNGQNMSSHKNLSLLGIYAKHSHRYDHYLTMMNRMVLFIFFLALMRQSNVADDHPLRFLAYAIGFGLFLMAEFQKFHRLMGTKINLLDSFKYKQIRVQKEKGSHLIVDENLPKEQVSPRSYPESSNQNHALTQNDKSNHSRLSDCSICLLQYGEDQNVIVVCCGHIFHQQCLIDWLKHKKECPLCRLNISEFYEEVSF